MKTKNAGEIRSLYGDGNKEHEAYYVLFKIVEGEERPEFHGEVTWSYDHVFNLMSGGYTLEGVTETLDGAEDLLFSIAEHLGFKW